MSTRAEISGGASFFTLASTQASPLSALAIVYGTILMSRCTTSSSNRRPISRFMAYRVLVGFVTAWRLADWPTRTWSSLLNATIDGVVRSPSLFSMTLGTPPSMTATQELVVPRSIPITFPILLLRILLITLQIWLIRGAADACFKLSRENNCLFRR